MLWPLLSMTAPEGGDVPRGRGANITPGTGVVILPVEGCAIVAHVTGATEGRHTRDRREGRRETLSSCQGERERGGGAKSQAETRGCRRWTGKGYRRCDRRIVATARRGNRHNRKEGSSSSCTRKDGTSVLTVERSVVTCSVNGFSIC
jgi:hypothetical protein